MNQLQRISDGVVFDMLGTKVSGRGVLRPDGSGVKQPEGHVVWLRRADGAYGNKVLGHGNEHLKQNFTAYPPQERREAPTGQLMRSDGLGDGRPFDVVAVGPGFVRIKAVDGWSNGITLTREYVQTFFTAYPPQEKPDRVDQLAEETDGWEPAKAYQVTFCPIDDEPLEPGHRVTEAYAGARVDAGRCPVCGRFFADDTLTEIKLWKD